MTTPNQEALVNKALYSNQMIVENWFLFTINANDYEKGIIYQDEYLNCLAIITDEIMSTDPESSHMSGVEDKLFAVKKAYCIMFRGNHYTLQYQILAAIDKVVRHERTQTRNVDSEIGKMHFR